MAKSTPPTDIFAERLRAMRESRGISQSELAALSGLQVSAVSHFETATRRPSFDNLKRLADALRVTTDYLIGRTDEIEGSAASVRQLYRHYSGLSAEYQEMADDFVKMLAEKAKGKRRKGTR